MYAYNFIAHFQDGSHFGQGDDVGRLAGGSAFRDLVVMQERGRVLEAFTLVGEHDIMVSMSDGVFTIDSRRVSQGMVLPDGLSWRTDTREMPDAKPARGGYPRALIYYRKNIVRAIEGAQPEITHFCLGFELGGVKTVLGIGSTR